MTKMNVAEVSVGDQVRYRVTKGRGRPAVGEIVAKNGLFMKIRNVRTNEVQNINRDKLTSPYEFRAYKMVTDEEGRAMTAKGTPRKPWTASGNPRKPRTPKVVVEAT